MLTITIVMFAAAALLALAANKKVGPEQTRQGMAEGLRLLRQMGPSLIPAFLIVGLLDVLISTELISSWLGQEAGLRAILIAIAAGVLVAGPPYAIFPIIGGLFRAGAGLGPCVAFVTAWSIANLSLFPFELSLMGPRFTAMRLSLTCLLPLLAGLAASFLG
ncbi:MAG: hypothetical protein GX182_02225 [Firmicutes bacterium]|jgi:uncharacterized membrane protein YraQ (UPF0718 family)|nr:hypothetical protein [Bacillota bacterium]